MDYLTVITTFTAAPTNWQQLIYSYIHMKTHQARKTTYLVS